MKKYEAPEIEVMLVNIETPVMWEEETSERV